MANMDKVSQTAIVSKSPSMLFLPIHLVCACVHPFSGMLDPYFCLQMSRLVGKPTMWFPKRSHTNRPVQAQKQARSLKFWIYKVEELYYPRSENKDADQLRGYRKADLRLCFRLGRLLVFPWGGSNDIIS